ncbi:EF-hand domain-containing protein [Phyllobacterium myrsinacearum]|uniref:EF-hand domain-containing protein n=1 Tax=Phyllobacterium myrsinacearum TaxID=28101 RepID=A0A2S9JA84_9HYPH|nr:EF-hand domain-containing protein [Phyllobacterium myrsinacearum]PRD49701.1 hypothetical protein C5750_25100 [Phyllobacterium myrsinacearum]PWV94714.1 hypothetical protein DEV92_102166 [Phyllobacterium myrsinacearum]RZV07177.1 hypothetical protein EV654_1846 [Phyllobacterium myrsinacearum]
MSRIIFISLLLTSLAGGSAQAGDRVWRPEPGTKSVKQDAISIQRQLDQELRAKFDAVASSNHLLTAQAAGNAGWGFIAEHFAQIDKDRDGYITFDDVQTFLDARSPLPAARARAAKKVQVVE